MNSRFKVYRSILFFCCFGWALWPLHASDSFNADVYGFVSSRMVGQDFVTFALTSGHCDLTVLDVAADGDYSPDVRSGHNLPIPLQACFLVVHRDPTPVPGYSFDFEKLRKGAPAWQGHKVKVRCYSAKVTVEDSKVTRIDTTGIYIEDWPPKPSPNP